MTALVLPPRPDTRGRATGAARTAVLVLVAAQLAWSAAVATPAAAQRGPSSGEGDDPGAAALLSSAAEAEVPHVGRVSVVTFSEDGPRVADLAVRVGPLGEYELRRPTRWLLGARTGGWLRTADGGTRLAPVAAGLEMDVEAVLRAYDAVLGERVALDTGPATAVHLHRRTGAPVQEVLYVDDATSLPVRRETRGPRGEVLRVVAYTSLTPVDVAGPGTVTSPDVRPTVDDVVLAGARDGGFDVPAELGAGFALLTVQRTPGMVTARYGDGLSVLSVYQQQGGLDLDAIEGAEVRHVADRDVWTWPGSEPVRLVWTSDERTWTVVSDAPLPLIEDAVASLPGELVGHDAPSRVRRGLARLWAWLTGDR